MGCLMVESYVSFRFMESERIAYRLNETKQIEKELRNYSIFHTLIQTMQIVNFNEDYQ